jgi:hypothetical protein
VGLGHGPEVVPAIRARLHTGLDAATGLLVY